MNGLRKVAYFVRGFVWTLVLRACGATVGKRLRVEGGLQFRGPIHSGYKFGDDVFIGRDCVLDIGPLATLDIGDRAGLTAWVYISAVESVTIGLHTLIGERVSIRDADHGMEMSGWMDDQPMTSSPVHIGMDVWVGCGAAVLRGSTIGNGAVVGANSVVKGPIDAFAIAVGTPARAVRVRA